MFDEVACRCGVGQQNHRLRAGIGDIFHRIGNVVGFHRIDAFGRQLQLLCLERGGNCRQTGFTEGIVGIKHADFRHTQAHRLLHDFLRLIVITGAHVEQLRDVTLGHGVGAQLIITLIGFMFFFTMRLAQRIRTGQRADQCDIVFLQGFGTRQQGDVGSAGKTCQHIHVFVDQCLRILKRLGRGAGIILHHQFQLFAVYATFGIHIIDISLHAGGKILADLSQLTGQRNRLADDDFIAGCQRHAAGATHSNSHRNCRKAEQLFFHAVNSISFSCGTALCLDLRGIVTCGRILTSLCYSIRACVR